MRRADAPRPGWYPDPTGRSGLLWWDGTDWTHHRRPVPPPPAHDRPSGSRPVDTDPDRGPVPTATQLRSRSTAARGSSQREVTDAVAEARRVARSEVDRAVAQATQQMTAARDRWQPLVEQYWRRLKRWLRVLVIVVVAFVALSTWASATMQTSLLEWLGERIDAVTAIAADPAGPAR